MLCGSVERRGTGEYMAEVRISSMSERPCADIEETRTAAGDAGGGEQSRRRKVHSLIDKVYAPANLAEAWKRVRENKGSAGILPSPRSRTDRPSTWPGCMPGYGTRPIGRPR